MFDFIYAISVFTHLGEQLGLSWIQELKRILKPGGHLYMKVHGITRLHYLRMDQILRFESGEFITVNMGAEGTNSFGAFHS
jgi:predicted SAM-dependent methyltransferase